jgi:hypothetical protein
LNDEPQLLVEPPHSSEAEQSVIGALLVANGGFDDIAWLSASDFYQDRHRRIWQCIARMLESGKPADTVTVCEELERLGDLDKAGGSSYIAGLSQNTPSTRNLKRYAEMVQARSVQRKLFHAGAEISEAALGLVRSRSANCSIRPRPRSSRCPNRAAAAVRARRKSQASSPRCTSASTSCTTAITAQA